MNPYCATGPRAGLGHHWLCPPNEPPDADVDLTTPKVDSGTCRDCGVSRVFTNAYRKGPYAGGGNWATVHADAAEYGRRMAKARAGRAAKTHSS